MLRNLTLLVILIAAVWMDVRSGKISNRLIAMGAGLGMMFQIQECGVMGIFMVLNNIFFPVIILYLLFLMHALGAGDIKLFSVIGSFLNFKGLCSCIYLAFLIGAVFSLVRLLHDRNLIQKIQDCIQYTIGAIQSRQITRYRENRSRQDVICFSIPILFGYLFYLLGVMR